MPDTQLDVVTTASDPRVPLALERTFLAWVRTALALMGFGFVVARFGFFLRELERVRGVVPTTRGISPLIGTALVILGVCVSGYSAYRFRSGLSAIERGRPPSARSAAVGSFVAVVLCAIGTVAAWYFVVSA